MLGAAFFVMEFVKGRSFYDQRLPEQTPTERAAIFDAMNDAVAKLQGEKSCCCLTAGYWQFGNYAPIALTCEYACFEALERDKAFGWQQGKELRMGVKPYDGLP